MSSSTIDSSFICPVCDGTVWQPLPDHTKRWLVRPPGVIYRCKNCGLLAVWPRPSEETNEETFNDPSYYRDVVGKKERFFRERVRLIKSLAQPHQKKLLDVGCALGDMLVIAREEGFSVEGIEFSEYAAQYAREHHGIQVSNTPVDQLPDETQDVVHANHVMEHVFDPLAFAIQLRRILTEDGLCVIEVPNEFMNLMVRFNDIVRRPRSRNKPSIHLFFFDPKTLHRLMLKAGFREVKLFTWTPQLEISAGSPVHRAKLMMWNQIRILADRIKRGSNLVGVYRK